MLDRKAIAKAYIEGNKARHRAEHGFNPFFTVNIDGAKRLNAFLTDKHIDPTKSPGIHVDTLRHFFVEAGIHTPLDASDIASVLGSLCSSCSANYIIIDAVVLASLLEKEPKRGR